MNLFEKYKMKKPAEFTRLVGVNYGAFQIILEKLEAGIVRYKQARTFASARAEKFFDSCRPTAAYFDLSAAISYFFAAWRNVFDFWKLCSETLYFHFQKVDESTWFAKR